MQQPEPCHSNMVWSNWDAKLGPGAAADPDLPAQTGLLHCSLSSCWTSQGCSCTETHQSVKSKPVLKTNVNKTCYWWVQIRGWKLLMQPVIIKEYNCTSEVAHWAKQYQYLELWNVKEKVVLNVLTTKTLDRQHYTPVFKVPCLGNGSLCLFHDVMTVLSSLCLHCSTLD